MNKQGESEWWSGQRIITILTDRDSWILPWAEKLAFSIDENGDRAEIIYDIGKVKTGHICFILGCTRILPNKVLGKNLKNLIVHESALPSGRGFAPLTWQILEGINIIPLCLIEAVAKTDEGPIVYKDTIEFEGHELCQELRAAQGCKTIDLCQRYLGSKKIPVATAQHGESTYYKRRKPEDSELDISRPIRDQLNLLRVVDNERYPAFFHANGQNYKLTIEKII